MVVHDLHPDYLSAAYAQERDGELIAVQHHHAHLAATLAEHGQPTPARSAVGAIFDGTGYGTDGTVWGGEWLCGDDDAVTRIGRLLPARLPGGERAIRQPWRMACAWHLATGPHPPRPETLRDAVSERDWAAVSELVATGSRAPVTSSMGRLFDGVAALCGIRPVVSYEGRRRSSSRRPPQRRAARRTSASGIPPRSWTSRKASRSIPGPRRAASSPISSPPCRLRSSPRGFTPRLRAGPWWHASAHVPRGRPTPACWPAEC